MRSTAQQVVDYCNGTYNLVLEKETPRTFRTVFEQQSTILCESTSFIFDLLYKRGYRLCIVYRKLTDGYKYDIAKQSEFVRFDLAAFIARLNKLEAGWAGTSTTGHSPRTNSQLEPQQVWAELLENCI